MPVFFNEGTTDGTSTHNSPVIVYGEALTETELGTGYEAQNKRKAKGGFTPQIAFKFVKSKFTLFGQRRYESRIKKLEKLSKEYLKLGHSALSQKFLKKMQEEVAFSEILGAGINKYIEKALIEKIKYKVKGGHIADTDFDKFTRVIPTRVLNKKKKVDGYKVFDSFVVYHYWNKELEEKREKKEVITPAEKSAMKDPILFGIRKDLPGKLFFIDEWIDDYCDLTFDDLVDVLELEEDEVKIPLLKKLFGRKEK